MHLTVNFSNKSSNNTHTVSSVSIRALTFFEGLEFYYGLIHESVELCSQ